MALKYKAPAVTLWVDHFRNCKTCVKPGSNRTEYKRYNELCRLGAELLNAFLDDYNEDSYDHE